MLTSKTVLLPIIVPIGKYCLNNGQCCLNFDKKNGVPFCRLDLDFMGTDLGLSYDTKGRVEKSSYCKTLI